MAGIQKILVLLIVLLVIVITLVFSMNNQMSVSLNFLLFETQPRGVAVWIILSFVVGAVLGILITLLTTFRISVSRRNLRKRLEKAELELDKAATPKDRSL
ncbi:LapA family protein [uncultured Marinobacter sp.]|uniref:LapA family protein n=1 Tax=uncultured Marinobacter sp. TaxID=187379 RepID=UPI0030DA6C1C